MHTTPEQLLRLDTLQPCLQAWFPQANGRPSVQPLAADASTRRYFRVAWSGLAAGMPSTCVLMVCDPWEPSSTPDFLAVGQHLHACGVRVPQVYGVAPAYGFIALEDYGDCPLATHWHHSTQAERYFWGQRAIDELIKMHTLGTQRYTASCPAFRLAFDLPKLLSELQFFRQHAIESLWQQPLTETERAAFDAAFTTLGTELAAQPRYFCHRDYHGWNIMVAGASVGLLDFQDARLGPQPYDLVSLLFDRGTLELLGQALLQKLVTYYLQQMEAVSGIRIDQQAFLELFDAVAVQRGLKAIGTFAYMAVVRQRPQYLPYIAPTLAYLRPLMERHSSCRALARLLPRRVPGWQ